MNECCWSEGCVRARAFVACGAVRHVAGLTRWSACLYSAKTYGLVRKSKRSESYSRFTNGRVVVRRFENVPDHNPYGDDDDDSDEDDGDNGSNGRFGRGGGGGGGGGGGDDEFESLWARIAFMWTRAMRDRPLITKMKTTLFLSALGDFIAQKIEGGEWDARRSGSVGLLALLWIGPNLHGWYLFLNRIFPGGRFIALKKVALDQLLFSIYLNTGFLFGLKVLEGNRAQDAFDIVRKQALPVALLNWKLWPASQLINFTLVPRDLQIVWVNLTALVWNIILSLQAHVEEHKDH